MRRGSELFVKAKDKDITSMATYYSIKWLTTERCVCFNTRTKKVDELVKVKKK